MIKKIFFILTIIGGCLFSSPVFVSAQTGEVNIKANVLDRRSTDTINDFDFSAINPNGQGKIYL